MAATQENVDAETLFSQTLDEVIEQADKTFSSEEGYGRYLDLHKHFMNFCNVKKMREQKASDYLTWL
jgi:hypothetical protein